MSKRSFDGSHEQRKKTKHHHQSTTHGNKHDNQYTVAESQLPAPIPAKNDVSTYIPFKVKPGMPELPPLAPAYAEAPFRHKSMYGYDRTTTASDMTYERLEFLGDAYIEVIASRLIYHHYPHLTAGQQSQLRELLVKNETLSEYARRYGFEEKLNLLDKTVLTNDARNRGNKGINKILGDSFEAYVAAVILSDIEYGFAVAEKWLTALWAPKLVSNPAHLAILTESKADDASAAYDPTAKATVQRQLLTQGVKLDYRPYKASVELKGDQLGQNRHYIALYFTGYGYENKMLGQGEGKNKVEAGNRAAMQAMQSAIYKECEAKLADEREAKKKAKAEQEAAIKA